MIKDMSSHPLLAKIHKFGLLFLKFHISYLGRKNNFVIIDTDDKKKILRTIDKETTTSILANEISKLKNSLIDVEEAKATASDQYYAKIADVYEKYENYIHENNLVDFDDLLLLTYKILNTR